MLSINLGKIYKIVKILFVLFVINNQGKTNGKDF